MLFEAFKGSLPQHFRTSLEGRNTVFHRLLSAVLWPYELFCLHLKEFEENYFDVEASGKWLENIAGLLGIKRGVMTDEELRSEVYFGIFLKGSDGSAAWIMAFIKKLIAPRDCLFIFNGLTMTFYFVLDAPLSKQQIELLRRIKPDGITLEVFCTIGKKIIAVARHDVVPLYANGAQMDFNTLDAVVSLKSVVSLSGNPPLEDAYFLVVEAESPEPVFSTNFIKVI